MSARAAMPLFVDTSTFYARADADDRNHDRASHFFDGIRSGDLPYRPLYTSQAVLAELATLLLYKIGHGRAVRTLGAIRESESFNVIPVGPVAFDRAASQFGEWDDQEISFVDHTTSVLARERDVAHVFAFDGDFETLGFSVVPGDVL